MAKGQINIKLPQEQLQKFKDFLCVRGGLAMNPTIVMLIDRFMNTSIEDGITPDPGEQAIINSFRNALRRCSPDAKNLIGITLVAINQSTPEKSAAAKH